MHISLSPIRMDAALTVTRTGDTLVINGQRFDFADLPEGATLPAEAIASDWITGPVTRTGGRICLTLLLPHGRVVDPDAPEAQAVLYPVPLVLDTDGPVDLPRLPPEATPDDAD